MKKEDVGDDEIINFVNEIEKLLSRGENHKTIESLKKEYPDKINELEEALLKYMGENVLKILKTEFPDKFPETFN